MCHIRRKGPTRTDQIKAQEGDTSPLEVCSGRDHAEGKENTCLLEDDSTSENTKTSTEAQNSSEPRPGCLGQAFLPMTLVC